MRRLTQSEQRKEEEMEKEDEEEEGRGRRGSLARSQVTAEEKRKKW